MPLTILTYVSAYPFAYWFIAVVYLCLICFYKYPSLKDFWNFGPLSIITNKGLPCFSIIPSQKASQIDYELSLFNKNTSTHLLKAQMIISAALYPSLVTGKKKQSKWRTLKGPLGFFIAL